MVTKDRAAEGDVGTFGAAAPGDAAVLLAQEGAGLGRASGSLAQDGGQVDVAVAGRAVAFLLGCRLLDARGKTGPGGEVPGGWEAGHVSADLSEDSHRRWPG